MEHRTSEFYLGRDRGRLWCVHPGGQHSVSVLRHVEDHILLAHGGHGPVQHQLPPLWRAQVLVSSLGPLQANGAFRCFSLSYLFQSKLCLLQHKHFCVSADLDLFFPCNFKFVEYFESEQKLKSFMEISRIISDMANIFVQQCSSWTVPIHMLKLDTSYHIIKVYAIKCFCMKLLNGIATFRI